MDPEDVADERRLKRIEDDISSLRTELRGAYKEVLNQNATTQASLNESRISFRDTYVSRADFVDRLTLWQQASHEQEQQVNRRMDRVESTINKLLFTCISLAVTVGGGILIEFLRAVSKGG